MKEETLSNPDDSETLSGEQVVSDALFGLFVTATFKDGENGEPRQGWIINCNPLIIRGESGTVYVCEGEPVVVEPQPPVPWWKEIYEFGLRGHRVKIMKHPRRNPVIAIRNPENGAVVKCFL